jgi:hypothetical protein
MLCKHYETPSGCSYNERCQFAHGAEELKSFSSVVFDNISKITRLIKT